jgi:hypothetical protein
MAIRKRIIVLIIISATFFDVFSQATDSFCDSLIKYSGNSDGILKASLYVNAFPNNNIQFYNDWSVGDVYLNDGKIARNQMLRYSSYLDEMIWLRGKDYKTGIVINETVKDVFFQSEKGKPAYHFKNVELRLPMQLSSEKVYLEVLAEGKISFYCYRKVKYIKNSTELFYPNYEYFIYKDKEYKLISLKKSAFLKMYPTEEKAILKSIIRNNKLKVRREADLMKLIELYNQL